MTNEAVLYCVNPETNQLQNVSNFRAMWKRLFSRYLNISVRYRLELSTILFSVFLKDEKSLLSIDMFPATFFLEEFETAL